MSPKQESLQHYMFHRQEQSQSYSDSGYRHGSGMLPCCHSHQAACSMYIPGLSVLLLGDAARRFNVSGGSSTVYDSGRSSGGGGMSYRTYDAQTGNANGAR